MDRPAWCLNTNCSSLYREGDALCAGFVPPLMGTNICAHGTDHNGGSATVHDNLPPQEVEKFLGALGRKPFAAAPRNRGSIVLDPDFKEFAVTFVWTHPGNVRSARIHVVSTDARAALALAAQQLPAGEYWQPLEVIVWPRLDGQQQPESVPSFVEDPVRYWEMIGIVRDLSGALFDGEMADLKKRARRVMKIPETP